MIWLSSCRHSGRDLSLLPTTSRSASVPRFGSVPAANRDGPSPAPNNEHYERCQAGAGVDVRTIIMLSGIPNRVDSHDLKEWLDKSSFGHYDFSYLRIDFSTELNVGYAFVSFTHSEHVTNFVNAKIGKPWGLYGSTKR
ncbi:hypothetical protein D6D01_10049 [Aureobasidium pullulans]|uniref:RRM domain-containing protein n=1 Tax=Aureobasidium pullulans TaxID=5580 RepID=A0A4S9JQL2_AURPU|nr:hypothetical protein D6D01_10049 [Aureobasidium pullulans]